MSGRIRCFPKGIWLVCGWGLLVFLTSGAFGLVLHPAGEPPTNWANKPPDSVVGRWRTNASCVAIAPNYILTVRHAGGGLDASVFFDGVEYLVKQIWNEPSTDGSADLRICRIETLLGSPANLIFYTPLYTLTDENNQEVVIGGYGDSRGATLFTPNTKPYAYDWDASSNNTVQRWGTNRVDQIIGSTIVGPYTTETFLADFDDLDVSGTTAFESIPADHDSGGGWFIQCGNSWKVLGLSAYLANEQHVCQDPDPNQCTESWFRTSSNANQPDPDRVLVIRISSYTMWINDIVPQPSCVSFVFGDLNDDCVVNELDLDLWSVQWIRTDCSEANNDCSGADFQPDGNVDLLDYSFLASRWMTGSELLLECN